MDELLKSYKAKYTKRHKQPSRGVLRKSFRKIYSKFRGEHPCRGAISIKLQSNFIEIALQYGCSPVNLLHIFTTLFYKNTSGWLLLKRGISVWSIPVWLGFDVHLIAVELQNCQNAIIAIQKNVILKRNESITISAGKTGCKK